MSDERASTNSSVDEADAERARAAQEHVRHARDAALRADVSGLLARAVSMHGMLQGCTEALVRHLGVAFARIWNLPRGDDVLELQASAGAYTRLDGRYSRVRVGDRKIGLIALERVPYLTNDVLADSRIGDKAWALREGMVAFAGYPLVVEGRTVGVMAMFARHALEPETLEVLGSIATAVAQGIERKRSEDELRRSEAYLAQGQRLSHTGSWAEQIGTGDVFWSAETCRIFGLDAEHAPLDRQEIRRLIHPDDRDRFAKVVEAAERERRGFELEFKVVRPNGAIRHVRSKAQPVLDDSGLLSEFMGVVMDVTERKRAERALRRARERVLEARFTAILTERTRLAREIHDTLLQGFTGVGLRLLAVANGATAQSETAAALREIITLAQRTLEDARCAVWDLRSPSESNEELPLKVRTAAEAAVRGTGLGLECAMKGPVRPLDDDVEAVVVLVAQEAVVNVVKHAAARVVRIRVTYGARRMRLSVADDGRGFTVDSDFRSYSGHWGLLGMRERASQIRATLSVQSRAGVGTEVVLGVPYDTSGEVHPRALQKKGLRESLEDQVRFSLGSGAPEDSSLRE
jgi:PAS domain S-box-containing protein